MPSRVAGADFESEVLNSDIPVLADFYSDSCIPCKRLSPILTQLENEYAGKVKIVKVNVNFEEDLVQKYEVQSAPTLILFSNGSEVSRVTGAVKKDEIINIINA